MDRFIGIVGIVVFLAIAFLMSNNRKQINYKTVTVGFLLQIALAVFILKVPLGIKIFEFIGNLVNKILESAMAGANFVFGFLTASPDKLTELFGSNSFIFTLQLIPTLIFMMVLVNILYYYGIMQKIIMLLGKAMNKIMDVSGAEALSNAASTFLGNVAAQSVIKPYLPNLTRSELLASMTGSTACISGSVLMLYAGWGVPMQYLLAASVMAAPGAFVVSKIVFPETGEPQTKDNFKIRKRRTDVNVLDAISKGASEGLKVALNVVAMLLALVALLSFIDLFIGKAGILLHDWTHLDLSCVGLDITHLSLKAILGKVFSIFALLMGVSPADISNVGTLIGEKFVINETLGYMDMVKMTLTPKSQAIATFALCGFANIATIAIQIGGIGELAPNQRKNLARLGFRALICGTLTSYISACIAGILV
ncbi:MAG: NupC/NupG family nucleoside CNT transporter [Candidatus Gastranaerophilaceae bacterium]